MDEHERILEYIVGIARARGFDDKELQAIYTRTDSEAGKNFMRKALAHSPHSLIFRHEFAKAFFGDGKILEEYPLSDGSGEYLKIFMPAWQAHLRKMVLEPEPIFYFRQFMNTCPDPELAGECSGCSDPHSEGTHQGCTKQHGHVGCDRV